MAETLPSICYTMLRRHVLDALGRYWDRGVEKIEALPIAEYTFPTANPQPHYILISLPKWAFYCGVQGGLLVPQEACSMGADWKDVDWFLAAFLMMECWHERACEQACGPIQSYSFRLRNWNARVWDRAWVNRIALFLRAWAANAHGQREETLFGPLPKPEIVVTHDVDAIAKTLPIRFKQCGFNLFNAGRRLVAGDLRRATKNLLQAGRFLFGRDDWWVLDRLLQMEGESSIVSQFNFYADNRRKNLKRWLLDPLYDVGANAQLAVFMQDATAKGAAIGLHPGFDAWKASDLILAQKEKLEAVLGRKISSCRQHWLRFSWNDTWSAQEKAGLRQDMTLMFNDRPGFRNASAVQWRPWDPEAGASHTLEALPTVLMDSHFYDYQDMTDAERSKNIAWWINETIEVGGQAAVLWHPHTLTDSYGWQSGFTALLEKIREQKSES